MISKPDDSAFAFSEDEYYNEQQIGSRLHSGLTKREYFAAQVLTGYLAAHVGEGVQLPDPITAAQRSVIYADELITALNDNKSVVGSSDD